MEKRFLWWMRLDSWLSLNALFPVSVNGMRASSIFEVLV